MHRQTKRDLHTSQRHKDDRVFAWTDTFRGMKAHLDEWLIEMIRCLNRARGLSLDWSAHATRYHSRWNLSPGLFRGSQKLPSTYNYITKVKRHVENHQAEDKTIRPNPVHVSPSSFSLASFLFENKDWDQVMGYETRWRDSKERRVGVSFGDFYSVDKDLIRDILEEHVLSQAASFRLEISFGFHCPGGHL